MELVGQVGFGMSVGFGMLGWISKVRLDLVGQFEFGRGRVGFGSSGLVWLRLCSVLVVGVFTIK